MKELRLTPSMQSIDNGLSQTGLPYAVSTIADIHKCCCIDIACIASRDHAIQMLMYYCIAKQYYDANVVLYFRMGPRLRRTCERDASSPASLWPS